MNYEEYAELFTRALMLDDDFHQIQIPVVPLEGETDHEAMYRWLFDQGIYYEENDVVKIDRELAEAFDPFLLKILDTQHMAMVSADIDSLEEKGYVYSSVDEDGNIVYGLTELGKAMVELAEE